ncbi:MAG: VCBS repeat-containing protein [Flavobacteriales bacterium]|nr:VCBS repeat-containing protein [Flavobacteriales bacterium]MBP9078902.1 VCBS repeat-containing protein [Flavobacteriales bacterium]
MVKLYALGLSALIAARVSAQPLFTNGTPVLAHTANSGGCMGVTDMDGDGLDDVVQLDDSKHVHILYQEADGSFTHVDYGSVSFSSQWGWAIADLGNDGHKDVVSGGNGDGTHFVSIASRGVFTTTALGGPNIFQQNMSMADVDNDGRVDVFACNDVGAPNLWFTDANGVPQINNGYINWATSPASDMSGNYGSCFTDFDNDGDIDLHIAKCRQGVNDPNDPRRWNRLFVNNGSNQYTDQAAAYGAQDQEQTWATDFGDYDNDGDLDMVSIEHSTGTQLFENDGTGHFTNATTGSGLGVAMFPLQCMFRDLDNDGFLDVLIAGGSEFFLKGSGDGTFTAVSGLFPYTKPMHGFAFGDLNRDGFEDVYANYGSGYVDASQPDPDLLWLNTPNGNHFFRVRLQGTTSNRDAIGAKVTITGPWGTQVREVRSGESYGLVNSFTLTFGLGAYTGVPTMVVRWPSGQEETFTGLHADQTITVVEGSCISPNVAISGNPATVLCPGGGPIVLTASPGTGFTWSTGGTGNQLTVTEQGNYFAVTGTGNCITQANLFVLDSPDETPSITADGPTTICPQDQVVLTSSPAAGYAWSNGSDQQSISVNAAGTYSVTVQGACGEFTSTDILVDHLNAPEAPQSDDVSIPAAGTAVLTAAGDSIQWFDAPGAVVPVGQGSPWTTPWLTENTTFWCADLGQNGGEPLYGGRTNRSNAGAYQTNASYYLHFSTVEEMIVQSVKVYANGAGFRTIALVEEPGGSVVTSGVFNIPNGESRVQLDWTVAADGDYGLRILSGEPQLWRDGEGSSTSYPYDLGGLGAITGSNAGSGSYYYFFYDWEVAAPAVWCASARTPVDVSVGPMGVAAEQAENALRLFPNPATDRIRLSAGFPPGQCVAEFLDLAGRVCLEANIQGATTSMVDVAALAPGVYTVKLRGGNGVLTASFVKQ